MDSTPESRIIHLHVPKTAGNSLRAAFERPGRGNLRVFPHYKERDYAGIDTTQYDFFSGHFGFKTAAEIGGQVVTVLRNPVDRFLSVYYFWRQLAERKIENTRNTFLASKYSLADFVKLRDEPSLIEAFYNRMTFQIAYGSSLVLRQELRTEGKSDDDIYKLAAANLSQMAVVGVQERMDDFALAMEKKFPVRLRMGKANVTKVRSSAADIDLATIRAIHEWSFMDIELYQRACNLVVKAESVEPPRKPQIERRPKQQI